MKYQASVLTGNDRGDRLRQPDGRMRAVFGPDRYCALSRATVEGVSPGRKRLVSHDEIEGNVSFECRTLRYGGCGRNSTNYTNTEQIRLHGDLLLGLANGGEARPGHHVSFSVSFRLSPPSHLKAQSEWKNWNAHQKKNLLIK